MPIEMGDTKVICSASRLMFSVPGDQKKGPDNCRIRDAAEIDSYEDDENPLLVRLRQDP